MPKAGRPLRWRGKVVGVIEGRRFRKTVVKSKHFLRRGNGYAIQSEVLGELLERGVSEIILREKESGTELKTTLRNYLTLGIPVNLGHGQQVCLDERYFDVVGEPQLKLNLY